MKINMCISILLLLLTQLIIGCGVRRGPFVELGVGMAPVVAHEKYTARKFGEGFWSYGNELIGEIHKDGIASDLSPAGNIKIGWGFNEHLLISSSIQIGKLSANGIGITVFQKKTAPSLFFDLVFSASAYGLSKPDFADRDPPFVHGLGAGVGVGYEFKKRWAVRGNFSLGIHDFNVTDQDPGEFLLGLFGVSTGYTVYDG